MSALKLEIKRIAIDDLVGNLEKSQEASEVASIELRGSVVGTQACMESISQIMATVKDQFDAGKLDLEQAQLVRRYLNTAVGSFATIIRNARTASAEKRGFSEGLKPVITRMKADSAKLQRSLDKEAESPSEERAAPSSLKSRRLEEDDTGKENPPEPPDGEVEITDEMISELAVAAGIPDLEGQIAAMVENEQNVQDTR